MADTQTNPQPPATNRTLMIVLGVVAGLSLIGVIILSTVLLSRGGDETAVDNGTPTPFTNFEPIASDPLVIGVDGSSRISVTLDVPVTLQLAGQSLDVRTQAVAADRVWQPNVAEEGTAVWVYGTIVNYVLGLPASDANRTLIEQLSAGDEIQLTTRGGVNYTFVFDSRQTVAPSNAEIFAQQTPGITLVLIGEAGNERLVANGRFQVSDAETGQSNVFSLGETAQLDNIQITVPSVVYVPDRPEAPAGFAFFQVDYEIQNVGLTAFDTGQLQLLLTDGQGNQYALSPAATQVGNYPALTGFLNAGQTVQATAGYQIPIGLSSSTLNWIVARNDTGAQIQVQLPFTGSGDAAASSASIALLQADVSADLSGLVLVGQVTNLASQPIVITESDLALTGNDGAAYLLLATNPPFPWTVPAGGTTQFSVTYQRPLSPTAVFTLLNQSFQLDGLR